MIARIFNGIFHGVIFGALFVLVCKAAAEQSASAFSALLAIIFYESFVVGSFFAFDRYFRTRK